MSAVRTIRKPPRLSQLVKASGGVYAQTALLNARAAQEANRDTYLKAITDALVWMGEWRGLTAPSESDWQSLHEASASVIELCDPEADAHLLRAARLLCEYIDRSRDRRWSREIGALYINTLKALGDQGHDVATRNAVLAALEALVPKQHL